MPVERPSAGPSSDDARLDELRQLLVGPERRGIEEIRNRLDDGTLRAKELARILPQIVQESSGNGNEIVDALTPLLERSLGKSVRDDPSVTAEILYPILGPAIWTAVRKAFAGLTESLNAVMERSLGPQSLQWRWEAFRSGRSFAEVAVSHNLAYRVEQVYLIDSKAGISLQSVGSGHGSADDDLVSGMLTAIQDFVRDSFSRGPDEHLDTLRMGDFLVCIERGPKAFLAAVVRGNTPTMELRETLRVNLALIHRNCAAALADSVGESGQFEACRPYMEACLREESLPRAPRKPVAAVAVLTLLALLAMIFVGFRWQAGIRHDALIGRLRSEPGIVVVESSRRGPISILRDPLALAPEAVLAELGFEPADVALESTPYISVETPIVLRRLTARIDIPSSVSLEMDGGTVRAVGSAPHPWIENLRTEAVQVPGVDRVDTGGLTATGGPALEALVDRIESTTILFDTGAQAPRSETEALVSRLVDGIRQLSSEARSAGFVPLVGILGNTDTSGSPEANLELSRRRADWVHDALVAGGVSPDLLRRDTESSRRPSVAGAARQRSVTFDVRLQTRDDRGTVP